MIHHGDCLEILKQLEPNSIDSLVTDPPAGISFMGKDWDGDKGGRDAWVAWMAEVMRECLRVMKPGAHGLVWSLPRTSHWTALALEDAGFEIRDCVYHIFGQGFPKSLDVSKAIDKAAGVKGEIIEQRKPGVVNGMSKSRVDQGARPTITVSDGAIRAPATDAAKQWSGWGTALKPAVECWWLIRKPCSEKTVAANVLKWGTGALNIDGCRIEAEARQVKSGNSNSRGIETMNSYAPWDGTYKTETRGRFPSHLILDEEAGAMLDEQSGMLKSGDHKSHYFQKASTNHSMSGGNTARFQKDRPGDSGVASRFFYCPKISASERGKDNKHPTVKPQKLMRYLCKFVTPPNGLVLDPFTGSGSTGLAALSEGFRFVGIERGAEYVAIAERRIEDLSG